MRNFFFALRDGRDQHHSAAMDKQGLLDVRPIILPWPVLYETLNPRFVGLPGALAWFERLVLSPNTNRLDDSWYREASFNSVLASAPRRRLSLVDAVLRSVIEDRNVPVAGILTFNPKDFVDACRQHRVEML